MGQSITSPPYSAVEAAERSMPRDARSSRQPVYLIGKRWRHDSGHSGYEGFARYVGTSLKPPSGFLKSGPLGRRINAAISAAIELPKYSRYASRQLRNRSKLKRFRIPEQRNYIATPDSRKLDLLVSQSAAVLHMLSHRRSLYHVLYGDRGLDLFSRVARLTGNLLVATFHWPRPPKELRGATGRRIVEQLAAIVLVSESQRGHYEGILPPERTFVVHHGIDTDFYRPAAGGPGEEPALITVGAHLRDFRTLGRAVDRIHAANPEARFVAVGTLNSKLRCSDPSRVKFLAGISDKDLRRAYQRSRVAVFAVRQFTASNALLEAMACGLPIVATDVGGVLEYLGEETGILCPGNDTAALADAVLQVLGDPSRAARMAAASRERALAYDYRVVAEQLRRVYATILALGPRRP